MTSIAEALRGWSPEEMLNLHVLMGGAKTDPSPTTDQVENKFKWLYFSRARAEAEGAATKLVETVAQTLWGKEYKAKSTDDLRPTPPLDELVQGAANARGVYVDGATTADFMLYLSHDVIISAVSRMSPKERIKFFEHAVPIPQIIPNASATKNSYAGPLTTFAGLGAAQASGFGVYMAATTALGFLTHAVGVTLPFAVYAGLTTTIAFAIGPAGFLAAGLWTAWKLTGPEWQKIIPGLVYIAHRNEGRRLGLTQQVTGHSSP